MAAANDAKKVESMTGKLSKDSRSILEEFRHPLPAYDIDFSYNGVPASGSDTSYDFTFTVTDNGKGFKADRATDLFMPFVRAAKTAAGGAGLGLTLLATSLSYFAYRVTFPKVTTPPTIVGA